jgi:hypothetical protein
MGLIFNHLSASSALYTTSSTVVKGVNAKASLFALTGAVGFTARHNTQVNEVWPGDDTFFFVSGSTDGRFKSVFGGDIVVSGSLTLGDGRSLVDAAETAAQYRIAVFDDSNTVGGESGLTWGNADGGGGILGVSGSIRLKGAFDLDATGSIDMVTTAGVSIDGATASNVTVTGAGQSLTLAAAGGGSQEVNIDSAGTGAAAIDLNATAGGITLDASSGVSLDGGAASNFSTSAGSLTISSEANRLFLTGATGLGLQGEFAGADAIVIKASNAAGGINVDAGTGGVDIDTTGKLMLTSSMANAGAIAIVTSNAAGGIKAVAGTGGIDVDTTGALSLSGSGNSELQIGGALDVDARNAITIDSAAAGISLDAAAASNFSTSGGAITIDGKTGVYIKEDGTNVIAIDSNQELSLGVSGKDVIIVGDLQVQGSTTTVSSSNTTFRDSIIGLGVSGSDSFNNVGDRALIFARGAAAHSFLPALNYDGSEFEFGTYSASPSSGSMGTHQAGVPVRTGHLKPISDDGATLGDANERWSDLFLASGGVVNFDNGNVSLTHSANALTVSSTDKLQFQDSGTFINSSEDGELNLSADGAMVDAIKLSAASGGVTVDAGGDIVLDADGGNVTLKDGGTTYLDFVQSSGDAILSASVHNKDVIFHGNNGTDVFRLDSSANSLFVASSKKIEFGDAGESIVGDGTNLAVSSSANFTVDAAADIILDAGGANVTFKDDGVTILDFVLNGTTNVKLDAPGDIILDAAGSDIILHKTGSAFCTFSSVSAGSEFDVPTGDLLIDVAGDLTLDAAGKDFKLDVGGVRMLNFISSSDTVIIKPGASAEDIVFQEDGGTEIFRVDSSAESVLMASGKKIEFADTGEHISGNGTDLTLASGGDIKLTATSDVELPTNVGLTFDSGAGGMKIEGDSSSNLTVTAGSDVKVTPGTGKGLVPSTDSSFDLGNPFRAGGSYLGSGGGRGADNIIANQTINTDASTNSPKALLYTVGSGGIGSAISGASSGLDQSSSLSTSTSYIGWNYGSSISLTAGQLIVAFDGSSYMPFVVLKDFSGSGSSIYVAYHSGVTITGTSLGTSTSSGLTNLYEAGSISSGGWPVSSPSSISADTVLQIYENSTSNYFALLVANTLSSSSRTPAIVYTKAVTGGYSSWSSAPSDFGSSSNAGGTFDIAWRKLYVDAIDLGGQGIISVGGVGAAGQVGIDLDADDDTSIRSSADDVIDFELGGTDRFQMTVSAILPKADNSYDLGSDSARFRNIYTGDLNLRNDRGNWTLIEEDDFIGFRNNKTGKRYAMLMEDITGTGTYGPGNDGEM